MGTTQSRTARLGDAACLPSGREPDAHSDARRHGSRLRLQKCRPGRGPGLLGAEPHGPGAQAGRWRRTAAGSTGPAEGETERGASRWQREGAQGPRLRERQGLVPGTRQLGLPCLCPQKGPDGPPAKAAGPRGHVWPPVCRHRSSPMLGRHTPCIAQNMVPTVLMQTPRTPHEAVGRGPQSRRAAPSCHQGSRRPRLWAPAQEAPSDPQRDAAGSATRTLRSCKVTPQ